MIEKYFKKGSDFLGSKYPIICGAMSWVSFPEFTAEISNQGGFGVYACAHNSKEILRKDLEKLDRLAKKPYGVNIVTISPNFEEQFQEVLEIKPRLVVFAAKLPKEKDIERAKEKGIQVMTFAPNLDSSRRMIEAGADALIIEGTESGGHIGNVSTLVLIQEILFETGGFPVFVAGGIGSGKIIAHLLLMGAAGVQLGTRFLLSNEAPIKQEVKEALLKARSWEPNASFGIDRRFGVVPVRAIRNKASEEFMRTQIKLFHQLEENKITPEEALKQIEIFWLGALKKAMQEGDLERGSLMAGNCVGLINDIKPVKKIIEDLVNEADHEVKLIKERMDSTL